MKTHIFFCTVPVTEMREAFAQACLDRWMKEPDCHITVLEAGKGQEAEFQKLRRTEADRASQSPIFVCTDDDCLPDKAEPFVTEARRLMEEYPQFGILSLWPTNSNLNPWTPEPEEAARVCVDGIVYEDAMVMEHVSAGGVRFMRKEILQEWPELIGRTYDSQHCQALREAGFRSGYFKNYFMNHLGRNYSTVWKQ